MHVPAWLGLEQVFLVIVALFALFNFRTIATKMQSVLTVLTGGPKPPSHPLPSNDSLLLNRKGSRIRRDMQR
jgi:hypothetical protein